MTQNLTKTRPLVSAAMLAVLLITTSACNTVKGLGDDIKSVGEAGEEAIN